MSVLYHYCSTATLHAIVSSRTIRLSALSLSNDTLEGKLVERAIVRLAERDGLREPSLSTLRRNVTYFEEMVDGLGFCLSEEGDLLSQWRGYADDAAGASIGFSTDYIAWLRTEWSKSYSPGINLERVTYDITEHDSDVTPIYERVKIVIDDGALRHPIIRRPPLVPTERQIEEEKEHFKSLQANLSLALLPLIGSLYKHKSPAFREEREWRLLSYLFKSAEDPIDYHLSRDRIIPYRPVKLEPGPTDAILEVILGPKHTTPPRLVRQFLERNGFANVKVRNSEASYR